MTTTINIQLYANDDRQRQQFEALLYVIKFCWFGSRERAAERYVRLDGGERVTLTTDDGTIAARLYTNSPAGVGAEPDAVDARADAFLLLRELVYDSPLAQPRIVQAIVPRVDAVTATIDSDAFFFKVWHTNRLWAEDYPYLIAGEFLQVLADDILPSAERTDEYFPSTSEFGDARSFRRAMLGASYGTLESSDENESSPFNAIYSLVNRYGVYAFENSENVPPPSSNIYDIDNEDDWMM